MKVFETPAGTKTALDATREFARTFSDGERKIAWLQDKLGLGAYTFRFVDGHRKYVVQYVPQGRIYQITCDE